MNGKLFISLVAVMSMMLLFSACSDQQKGTQPPALTDTTGISSTGTMRFEGVMISVPSPIQVATLIKKQKIKFNETHVNSLQNKAKYLNQTKKAMNIGVYGADLAYLANYDLGQINNDYFDAVASLSSELGLLEHIDKKLITRLSSNLNNVDSIHTLNASFFNSIDDYLKANEQPHISSFILIGGWIESLHLSSLESKSSPELRMRLAEQKYSAASILSLIEKLDDPVFNPIKSDVTKLCNMLSDLESKYVYRQPITDHREKTTYLRSQTSVDMSEDQLNEISAQIQIVRNIIIE